MLSRRTTVGLSLHLLHRTSPKPPRLAARDLAVQNRCSSTTTTPSNGTTVHPLSKTSPSESYLHRSADRELPSVASLYASRRRWIITIPIFLAILTASALGIFNYQKVSSPIITSTLYALRTNSKARAILGDEVYFASRFAWIWGHINLVQGRVDVTFKVKGTRRQGYCRFKAKRMGGRDALVSEMLLRTTRVILVCPS